MRDGLKEVGACAFWNPRSSEAKTAALAEFTCQIETERVRLEAIKRWGKRATERKRWGDCIWKEADIIDNWNIAYNLIQPMML